MTEEEKESLMCALDYLSDLEVLIEDCKKLLAKALFELGGLEDGQSVAEQGRVIHGEIRHNTGTTGFCERTDTDS